MRISNLLTDLIAFGSSCVVFELYSKREGGKFIEPLLSQVYVRIKLKVCSLGINSAVSF